MIPKPGGNRVIPPLNMSTMSNSMSMGNNPMNNNMNNNNMNRGNNMNMGNNMNNTLNPNNMNNNNQMPNSNTTGVSSTAGMVSNCFSMAPTAPMPSIWQNNLQSTTNTAGIVSNCFSMAPTAPLDSTFGIGSYIDTPSNGNNGESYNHYNQTENLYNNYDNGMGNGNNGVGNGNSGMVNGNNGMGNGNITNSGNVNNNISIHNGHSNVNYKFGPNGQPQQLSACSTSMGSAGQIPNSAGGRTTLTTMTNGSLENNSTVNMNNGNNSNNMNSMNNGNNSHSNRNMDHRTNNMNGPGVNSNNNNFSNDPRHNHNRRRTSRNSNNDRKSDIEKKYQRLKCRVGAVFAIVLCGVGYYVVTRFVLKAEKPVVGENTTNGTTTNTTTSNDSTTKSSIKTTTTSKDADTAKNSAKDTSSKTVIDSVKATVLAPTATSTPSGQNDENGSNKTLLDSNAENSFLGSTITATLTHLVDDYIPNPSDMGFYTDTNNDATVEKYYGVTLADKDYDEKPIMSTISNWSLFKAVFLKSSIFLKNENENDDDSENTSENETDSELLAQKYCEYYLPIPDAFYFDYIENRVDVDVKIIQNVIKKTKKRSVPYLDEAKNEWESVLTGEERRDFYEKSSIPFPKPSEDLFASEEQPQGCSPCWWLLLLLTVPVCVVLGTQVL